jgi:hypothetical protein
MSLKLSEEINTAGSCACTVSAAADPSTATRYCSELSPSGGSSAGQSQPSRLRRVHASDKAPSPWISARKSTGEGGRIASPVTMHSTGGASSSAKPSGLTEICAPIAEGGSGISFSEPGRIRTNFSFGPCDAVAHSPPHAFSYVLTAPRGRSFTAPHGARSKSPYEPELSPDFAIASSQASTEHRTRSTPELLPLNRSPFRSISTSMLIGSASPGTGVPDLTL